MCASKPALRPDTALFLWLLLTCWSQVCCGGDWTSYLNGNSRSGFTDAELDGTLTLKWVYHSPVKPELAWSGPRSAPIEGHVMLHRVDFDASMQTVIQDGKVFFGSTVDNRVFCLDAATGKPLWEYVTDGAIRLAPTLAFGNVYFGSDDGCVYCLSASDGREVWKMRVAPKDERLLSRGEMISRWPVRTGVLIDGEVAYFGAGIFPHEFVYLVAVDAVDGSVVWRNDTISQQDAGRNDLSPQGYLLADADQLYVPSGRSLPVAISKATGEIAFQRTHSWRTDAGGVVGGTRALLGDDQLYAGGPHHYLAMDRKTGDVGAAWVDGKQMVLVDRLAYLLDGNRLFCVDRSEHTTASQEKQKWFLSARANQKNPEKLIEAQENMAKYREVGILWQAPCSFTGALIATENLIIAGGENSVVAFDRRTGEPAWQYEVDGTVRGLSATEHLLTVSTDAGLVYGFVPPQSGVEEQQIDSKSQANTVNHWPAPAAPAFEDDDRSQFFKAAAKDVLARSDQRSGYCLVIGNGSGRLAYELSQQSRLSIYAIEPDREQAKAVRAAYARERLDGSRITVVQADLHDIPFSNYFANLIVSETHLTSGKSPCDPRAISRFLKPCGGVMMLGQPAVMKGDLKFDLQETKQWMTQVYQSHEGQLESDQDWVTVKRGALEGAGKWTHQYGNVANTSYTEDYRIRDGLGVLWYGDPGPSAMINRHEAAGAPLSTNGRMFIQGTNTLMAYDAYNGNFLWEFENPGALRTGVFNNRETHNLAADDDVVYMAIEDKCMELDAATGQVLQTFTVPESQDGHPRAWAYLAHDRGQVFGTATIRQELEQKMRRRGLTVSSQTDSLFAVDAKSGQRVWTYRGDNILHTTIAIGPKHVYFIDSSLSPEQRQNLYTQDKGDLKQLSGEEAAQAEANIKALDVRLAVALDRFTGEKIWERAVDVTDTTNVSAGGGNLTVMYADNHLVLCGANANGHYWKQFLAGEFEKRKLIVLDAESGQQLWAKDANYMNRPAVIGNEIFAEPWAFDLHSGETKKRPHPLTGAESDWRFSRPGHHCGIITATPNMMFFRSGFIGYYDLYSDSGTRHFAGQRLGCWINAIPGNGLVMIPEASAGCVCQFSIASTVVLEPKSESRSWGIFSAVGDATPVKRIAINLGAPGDRKDFSGLEWFGYPRPSSRERLEYVFDLQEQTAANGGWFNLTNREAEISGTSVPWVFLTGAKGLQSLIVPLLGENDEPSVYTVRLYYAAVEAQEEWDNMPTVRLQGKVASNGVELEKSPADSAIAWRVIEYQDIQVERNLEFAFDESSNSRRAISAIEIVRQ